MVHVRVFLIEVCYVYVSLYIHECIPVYNMLHVVYTLNIVPSWNVQVQYKKIDWNKRDDTKNAVYASWMHFKV